METEHTNPSGEVSDDELVQRLLAQDGGTESEEEHEPESPVEQEEEAEEQHEEAPATPRHRVKVDGKEEEVPLDELIAGYQRQSDYTRKTQEAAELRKAAEAERQQIAQERARYAQGLQQLAQQLQPPQIDWEALERDDPFGYVKAVQQEQARQQKAAQVHAEQQRLYQQQQHEDYQQRAAALAEASKRLAERIPEYADPEKRQAVQTAIRTYAQSIGFTADELAEASDPRAVEVLNKARLYDELKARAAKAKPVAVQTAIPGAVRPPPNKAKQAADRLKRSGSDADALAYLLNR